LYTVLRVTSVKIGVELGILNVKPWKLHLNTIVVDVLAHVLDMVTFIVNLDGLHDIFILFFILMPLVDLFVDLIVTIIVTLVFAFVFKFILMMLNSHVKSSGSLDTTCPSLVFNFHYTWNFTSRISKIAFSLRVCLSKYRAFEYAL
jgi:hypothetical protein